MPLIAFDPRRSLAARLIWLVIALAASFAAAASLWTGRVARQIVVQQHVRRLVLETDQLASDLGQAVSVRLAAVRALPSLPAVRYFTELRRTTPDLDWVAVADAGGVVLASNGSLAVGQRATDSPWFAHGVEAPWIGMALPRDVNAPMAWLGDLSIPLRDADGKPQGVVLARLSWPWADDDVRRLSSALNPGGLAQTLVLDAAGVVQVGPPAFLNRPWAGTPAEAVAPLDVDADELRDRARPPRFERLPGGQVVLAARAPLRIGPGDAQPRWEVQLSEPRRQVYARANGLAEQILWISLCLGALTALFGALGARRLTDRLRRLTRSAAAVGRNAAEHIEVPSGRDEVAQLATVLAKVLDDLQRERRELLTLSGELERRVAVRTREVERLADESRYAAVVRERLQIARDLHDTLAHSMMAMLSEVRLLRRIQAHDPASLPEELARAEQVAHAGLNEARTAIAHMRVNAVRDTGLGPALARAFERFIERTGAIGACSTDPDAARFGDERAEVMFRMAEEALRNVERHAQATRVTLTLEMGGNALLRLKIVDNGVGFDPAEARPGHFGLEGLREQARLIDAGLTIISKPGGGTAVTIELRVAPQALGPLGAGL